MVASKITRWQIPAENHWANDSALPVPVRAALLTPQTDSSHQRMSLRPENESQLSREGNLLTRYDRMTEIHGLCRYRWSEQ